MEIAVVVGARPNFVKVAALLIELRQYPEVRWRLIHTGQHYDADMSTTFFAELGIPEPHVDLGVRSACPAEQTAEIMLRLARVFASERTELVLVVGDVNSTLGSALTAVKMQLRCAHVEAGLRSFDRTMPEEVNRILVDAVADYCFTTEPVANENLLREGVAAERIHYVGNVMIDTLFRFRRSAARSRILDQLGLTAHCFAVLTLHRPSNVDDPETLRGTVEALQGVARHVPIIFPVHPRTRARLVQSPKVLAGTTNLRLIHPLPYLDFLNLMANAACVLTDSGGIQEETTALGIPCLTLRTTTERPITISQGTNRLVGTEAEKINEAWAEIRQGRWPTGQLPELWDGKSAGRIANVLLNH